MVFKHFGELMHSWVLDWAKLNLSRSNLLVAFFDLAYQFLRELWCFHFLPLSISLLFVWIFNSVLNIISTEDRIHQNDYPHQSGCHQVVSKLRLRLKFLFVFPFFYSVLFTSSSSSFLFHFSISFQFWVCLTLFLLFVQKTTQKNHLWKLEKKKIGKK